MKNATERAVLASVGLSTVPWPPAATDDPLRRSAAEDRALFDESDTISDAASRLQVNHSQVHEWLRTGGLVDISDGHETRLPGFQFERTEILPGLREILVALPANLNPLDITRWFVVANADLETPTGETLSPRDWLLRGDSVDEVVMLARGFESPRR